MVKFTRQITLTERGVEAMDSLDQVEGMPQKAFLSRLVEFYADLSPAARRLVLGTLPAKYAADAAKDLKRDAIERIEQLENQGSSSPPPPESSSSTAKKKIPKGPKIDQVLGIED